MKIMCLGYTGTSQYSPVTISSYAKFASIMKRLDSDCKPILYAFLMSCEIIFSIKFAQFTKRLTILTGWGEVMLMSGLRYTKADNIFQWENSTVAFDHRSVNWTSVPQFDRDSCFAFYKGNFSAVSCVNETGYHFFCE
jgi:hypothetical protein